MTIGHGLPALHRGLAIIEAVARRPDGLAFSAVGDAIGEELPPSTRARLLASLVDAGVLARDAEGLYRGGPRLRALARSLRGTTDLADIAGPLVSSLAEETGESAACFRGTDDGAELVAKHELPERFRYMPVGGVNRDAKRHGFARLLAGSAKALVSEPDDQPGLTRIVARAGARAAIGLTCLTAGLDAPRRASLAASVGVHAARLAAHLDPA